MIFPTSRSVAKSRMAAFRLAFDPVYLLPLFLIEIRSAEQGPGDAVRAVTIVFGRKYLSVMLMQLLAQIFLIIENAGYQKTGGSI